MSHASKARRSLFLLILGLSLSSLPGCRNVCIPLQPLPIESPPALHQVELYPPGSPLAEYCLTDRGRRDVLINFELYRSALESSRTTIQIHNKTINPAGGK